MKRISLILCLALVIQMFTCFTYANEGESGQYSTDSAVSLMIQLGIFPEDVKAEETVTRGQAARYIIGIYGKNVEKYANVSGNTLSFNDVLPSNPYFKYIAVCKQLGIVSGDDGFYYPNREILPTEMIKMLIDTLGYKKVALIEGGYPQGYISRAVKLQILNGIDISSSSITHEQLARMFEEALEASLLEATIISDTNGVTYEVVENTTALSAYLHIFTIDGIVNGIGECAFSGISGREGYVYINGREVIDNLGASVDLLGMPVKAYIREENEQYFLVAAIEKQSGNYRKIDLEYDEIDGKNSAFSETNMVYVKNDKVYEADISQAAEVIYNGRSLGADYRKTDLCPEYGNVTLIDNDNNNVYDVVKVWDYEVDVIKSVREADRQIIFDDTTSFDAERFSGSIIVYKDGKKCDIRDLNSNMTVIYAVSKDKSLIVFKAFSDRNITGTVTKILKDKITVDGTEYKTICDVKLGTNYTFYLDDKDVIVFSKEGYAASLSYGYIAAVKAGSGFDADQIRLLTEKGSLEVYDLKDTLTYNGTRMNAKDIVKFYSARRGLIKYRLNSQNQITQILTPQDNTQNKAGYDDGSFSLDYQNSALEYNRRSGNMNQYTFGKYYLGESKTVIMRVPSSDVIGDVDDSEFVVIQEGDITHNEACNVEIYDSDKYFAPRIVLHLTNGSYYGGRRNNIRSGILPSGATTVIVTGLEKTLIDDEVVDKITYMSAGKESFVYCKEDVKFAWHSTMFMAQEKNKDENGNTVYNITYPNVDNYFIISRDLGVGDIIQFSTLGNFIYHFRLVYKNGYDQVGTQRFFNRDIDEVRWDYTLRFRGIYLMVGEALVTNYERIVFDVGNNKRTNVYMSLSTTTTSNCVIYDTEHDRVYKASPLDIKAGDKVALVTNEGAVCCSIIIR